MTQADDIRAFAKRHYIDPARVQGNSETTIRAGDIHKNMKLVSAMPAVCSAIGGHKFQSEADVRLQNRVGPKFGANVYFTFDLHPTTSPKKLPSRSSRKSHRAVPKQPEMNFDDSIVLVSCVKSKQSQEAPARELYTSTWFQSARTLAETSGARWFILSSLYGLVPPDQVIRPYDYTLNDLGVSVRRKWATQVLTALYSTLQGEARVIFFAGVRYREFLVGPIEKRGMEVVVPMEGLRLGEQLSWMAERI